MGYWGANCPGERGVNEPIEELVTRPARLDDAECLLAFYKGITGADAHHFRPWPSSISAMQKHLADVRSGRAISVVTVTSDGRIVGHCFLKNVDAPAPGQAWRDRDAVSETRRGGFFLRLSRRAEHVLRAILRRPRKPRLGIGLLDSAQGRGLGKALMQTVLTEARARGVPAVTLGVHKDNVRAVELYKGFGFTVVGDLSQQRPNDSYEMILRIHA